jgi:hypothetical protein
VLLLRSARKVDAARRVDKNSPISDRDIENASEHSVSAQNSCGAAALTLSDQVEAISGLAETLAVAGGGAEAAPGIASSVGSALRDIPWADETGAIDLGGDDPSANDSGVSDSTIIVRGGVSDLPASGETFSGTQGSSVEEAAGGLKHGQFRWTTAGEIRASGGSVETAPELDPGVGQVNYQHMDVCLGAEACDWSDLQVNPVQKPLRFGGADYPFYNGFP